MAKVTEADTDSGDGCNLDLGAQAKQTLWRMHRYASENQPTPAEARAAKAAAKKQREDEIQESLQEQQQLARAQQDDSSDMSDSSDSDDE